MSYPEIRSRPQNLSFCVVPWVNSGLPLYAHEQSWCLLLPWLHRMPAMRHAENSPLVTKSLWEVTFPSVESENLPILLKWDLCAEPLYSCHSALLPLLQIKLLTLNPDQRREQHSVCTGLTASFSPTSPLPSPILLSFPVFAVGWAVGGRALSLSICVPVLYFLWLTHHSSQQSCWAGGCCEDFRGVRVTIGLNDLKGNLNYPVILWLRRKRDVAGLPLAAEEPPTRLGKYRNGNSLDCDSFYIMLTAAFRDFQWDLFFCKMICRISM